MVTVSTCYNGLYNLVLVSRILISPNQSHCLWIHFWTTFTLLWRRHQIVAVNTLMTMNYNPYKNESDSLYWFNVEHIDSTSTDILFLLTPLSWNLLMEIIYETNYFVLYGNNNVCNLSSYNNYCNYGTLGILLLIYVCTGFNTILYTVVKQSN